MKKVIKIFIFSMILGISVCSTNVSAADWPDFPNISYDSKAVMVMENSTKTLLIGDNEETEYAPASITKILTTLVALENDPTMSKKVNVVGVPSGATLHPSPIGDTLTMEDALYTSMLQSDNAVAASVGIAIAGSTSDFANMMNQKAAMLGCKHSHFVTANGLGDHDGDHYTTAYDFGLISCEAFKNPTFRKITGETSYVVHGEKRTYDKIVPFHNLLVHPEQFNFDYCVGGKTGQTTRAGNTLVSYATKDGMTLTCVQLKGPKHEFKAAAQLFNYCYDNFELHRLDKEDPTVINDALKQAQESFKFEDDKDVDSAIYLDTDSNIVLPKGITLKDANHSVDIYKDTRLSNGTNTIGKITYTLGDRTVCSANICLQYYKSSINNILNQRSTSNDPLLLRTKKSNINNITEILIDTLIFAFILFIVLVMITLIKNSIRNKIKNRV